jgi:hypothetical protein
VDIPTAGTEGSEFPDSAGEVSGATGLVMEHSPGTGRGTFSLHGDDVGHGRLSSDDETSYPDRSKNWPLSRTCFEVFVFTNTDISLNVRIKMTLWQSRQRSCVPLLASSCAGFAA